MHLVKSKLVKLIQSRSANDEHTRPVLTQSFSWKYLRMETPEVSLYLEYCNLFCDLAFGLVLCYFYRLRIAQMSSNLSSKKVNKIYLR